MIQTELHPLTITSDKLPSGTHPRSPPAHCRRRHDPSSATQFHADTLMGATFPHQYGYHHHCLGPTFFLLHSVIIHKALI